MSSVYFHMINICGWLCKPATYWLLLCVCSVWSSADLQV